MDKLNLDKSRLRKFGITMGIAFMAITIFILLKHKHTIFYTSIISAVFFILALVTPVLLKPVYIFWTKLALILGWINTRLILLIIFYFVFAPIGLAMRLFGVDLLERGIERSKETYWKKKDKKAFNPLDYERQF